LAKASFQGLPVGGYPYTLHPSIAITLNRGAFNIAHVIVANPKPRRLCLNPRNLAFSLPDMKTPIGWIGMPKFVEQWYPAIGGSIPLRDDFVLGVSELNTDNN
jgi:hypothetical protein